MTFIGLEGRAERRLSLKRLGHTAGTRLSKSGDRRFYNRVRVNFGFVAQVSPQIFQQPFLVCRGARVTVGEGRGSDSKK